MDLNVLVKDNIWWILLLFVWSTAWKAWALWIAAKKDQKVWFLIFIIVNTVGVLEIFYIFYFSKQPSSIQEKHKKA